MQHDRKTSHSVYDVTCHGVWITTYRKPVLHGPVAERVRELIREICQAHEVEILTGHISKDHVHLLVSLPPHLSVSRLLPWLTGQTSRTLLVENKDLSKTCWGQHLWGRGYCAASSGNVTDEVIMH